MGAVIRFLIIGFAGTVGILGVTMTFRYGLVFTGGGDRMLLAALFALFDAIKCLLPGFAAYLLLTGAGKWVWKARLAYYLLAVMTLGSHVGLVMTLKAHDDATALTTASQTENTADKVIRLKRDIAALEAMPLRPLGTIETQIGNAERNPIFTEATRSNRCADDTLPASREFCRTYRDLIGERTNRQELARLSGELESAKLALANQLNQKAGEIVTPIAEDLAAQTGLSNRTVMLILAVWMAILIEFCSSQVLELAYVSGHKPPAEAPETAIPTPLMPAIAADTLQNDGGIDAEPASGQPKADAQDWVGRRLLGHRRASVRYQAAYDAHVVEAETSGSAPASKNAFSRALKFHKYEAKRIGGERELMILGAVLKEQREVGSLRVVK